MSHVQSHHRGAEEAHDDFLVVFKVHGDAIQVWSREKAKLIGKTHNFRISCHNVETHEEEHPGSDIQVLVIGDPAPALDTNCNFHDQELAGQEVTRGDLVIFMTGPMASARKTSYAIDVMLGAQETNFQDHQSNNNYESIQRDEKLGKAYVFLDPKFSSQGIQMTPIIASHNHMPIGQMQIEYLIVTNPVAYGVESPKPMWLFADTQMDSGHRGAGSGRRLDLPDKPLENTIDSFNYAHRHGADMCELDVVMSKEGIPVVYHDFDVDAVAAQQSSQELGKFRVQVNEFTVKQLRDFRLLALHDGEGCPYTLNVPNQREGNRPFPTLAEVLNQVDESCGFNVEIKWPQMLESGKMEARKYREINDFIDRIINVVMEHGRGRRIVLESFDADLVIMLRMKQNKYPVVFLSQAMTDKYERYVDVRTRSISNGVYFAQAFDLAGIDLILDYYLASGKKMVDFIKNRGLIPRAWGDLGDSPRDTLDFLKGIGIQCITYDKIDLVKRKTDHQ